MQQEHVLAGMLRAGDSPVQCGDKEPLRRSSSSEILLKRFVCHGRRGGWAKKGIFFGGGMEDEDCSILLLLQ
jgi:hypothetical protein